MHVWILSNGIMNKNKRGGKRPGSGAKKKLDSEKKEPTKVMRVPKSLVPAVKKLIANHSGKGTLV